MNKNKGGCEMETCGDILDIRAESITYKPFHLSKNLRIIYVLKGSISCRWIAGIHVLCEGEIEILNINEPVSIEKNDNQNLVLTFEIDADIAKKSCDFIDKGLFNCNTTLFYSSRTDKGDQEIIKAMLRSLYNYYIKSADEVLIKKEIEKIISIVGEKCHDLRNMFREDGDSDIRAERFFRIYTYLYENFDKKINLKELAESEYVSLQYLSKEFNERLNINFKDTLEYYRVIQSVRYLITSKTTITMISELCGFSATRYFYKHFSKYLNCTPVEFRNKYLTRNEEVKILHPNSTEIKEKIEFFDVKHSDIENFSNIGNKEDIIQRFNILKLDNYRGQFGNSRRINKCIVEDIMTICNEYFPTQIDILQQVSEKGNSSVLKFILFIKNKEEETLCLEEIILKVERITICAYYIYQYTTEKGLAVKIINDIVDRPKNFNESLGLSEKDIPIMLIEVGYPT